MVIARRAFKLQQMIRNKLAAVTVPRRENFLLTLLFGGVLLVSGGCGQTAKPVISSATGQVNTYFGGPFIVAGSAVAQSAAAFDHPANRIAVSGLIVNHAAQVPTNIIDGSFASADTGFLGITESFATTSTGLPSPQNPSLTGAWAVEIPGVGTLANLLSVNTTSTPATISAAPVAMAQNTACPNSSTAAQFLYVTVPYVTVLPDMADYGIVGITSQGSAVTFNARPFFVGSQAQPVSTVTGGCSQTVFGALTAYPFNSFGDASNLELISIGSGFLVSSFNHVVGGGGAFGGGTGVIGVAVPSSPLDVSSVVAARYNGFVFSPRNTAKQQSYDITVLASSFGNHTATSQACSALQASLAANNGQGAGTVAVLPSANSIFGGEFLTMSGAGNVNDPTGASGSENCDVVIDLGMQDPSGNGLFSNATVFIGSTFPPFSTSNPWHCGGVCAVSFPAVAIVGQVQGKYAIFVSASGSSSPPAQLPDGSGNLNPQPLGIYLFQKM
jgi:hypothetical protein